MKSIAFLIGNLNKEHGGAQQLLYDICRHLPEAEFDKTVYYMFGEGTYQDAFERHGTTVVDVSASSNYDLTAFLRLVRNLRSENHDILHTNSPISGSWGRPAAKLGQINDIVSVEHNVHTSYSRLTRTVNGLTLPLADAVIGVSQTVSDSYTGWERRLFRDAVRTETIRNGVDIIDIRKQFWKSDRVLREFTPFSPSDQILGTMGRLHKQKGYEYLIRAFSYIKEQSGDAKLLIIGDGPERGTLQDLAKKTDHIEDIHFTGYVPDVYPFLPNFDIAIFPSRWEGFGLTPVESMAAGRPVVATDIPTFQEVVGDAGILVEPEDEAQLAQAVISLLEDRSRQEKLGQKGYERATQRFSIERTAQEYADLYRELVNE